MPKAVATGASPDAIGVLEKCAWLRQFLAECPILRRINAKSKVASVFYDTLSNLRQEGAAEEL